MQSIDSNHVHEWKKGKDGYFICKTCFTTATNHYCMKCHSEYDGFKVLFTENDKHLHFCSRICLMRYLQSQEKVPDKDKEAK